ncbi:RNA-binding protein with serine-rich domain like [Quillaja saponaria]|nr:RNA-binding protein with serine-rich domain like [Quillaja saponaria]
MASMDHENRRESGENPKVHSKFPHNGAEPVIHHCCSVSSTSSDSSQEFDVTSKDAHSSIPLESKQADELHSLTLSSPDLTSPSPCWSIQSGSATPSHDLQTMDQPAGYDPNRIPSSIFSSKPATPMEWSVASNESLFSLHLGNNSFSRDHAFLLNNSDEWTTLPPVEKATNSESKNPDMENSGSTEASAEPTNPVTENYLGSKEKSSETPKVVLNETPEVNNKEKMAPAEDARISTRSDTSSMSTQSFRFPVFVADSVRNSTSTVESEKHLPEKQLLPQNPETATKPTGNPWFSCFSCCKLC